MRMGWLSSSPSGNTEQMRATVGGLGLATPVARVKVGMGSAPACSLLQAWYCS